MKKKQKKNIYTTLILALFWTIMTVIFTHLLALTFVIIGVGLQGNSGDDAMSQYVKKLINYTLK